MHRTFLMLYLRLMLMHIPESCVAAPRTHPLDKRGPIICQPIGHIQRLSFRDCVGAFNSMAQGAHNLQQILSFGIGPDVNVPINGDPLTWEYGTFAMRRLHSLLQ